MPGEQMNHMKMEKNGLYLSLIMIIWEVTKTTVRTANGIFLQIEELSKKEGYDGEYPY